MNKETGPDNGSYCLKYVFSRVFHFVTSFGHLISGSYSNFLADTWDDGIGQIQCVVCFVSDEGT